MNVYLIVMTITTGAQLKLTTIKSILVAIGDFVLHLVHHWTRILHLNKQKQKQHFQMIQQHGRVRILSSAIHVVLLEISKNCTNPIIFGIWDGIIPSWAAKRRMKELKIPYESRKVHFNSHASHNFFPMNGLAGVVKKNSTMSREAANGGIFIYHNC